MSKKIISVLLAALCLLAACVPSYAQESNATAPDGGVYDDSYPVVDYLLPIKIIRAYKNLMYSLTGSERYAIKRFKLTLDEALQSYADSVTEQSGLDFNLALSNIPYTGDTADAIATVLHLDIPRVQSELNDKAAELRKEGKLIKSVAIRFLSVWLGNVEQCDAKMIPVEGRPELLQMAADITYADGRTDFMKSDIYYNVETQQFTNLEGGGAILGYSLDLSSCTIYTEKNAWQRSVGFCLAYDLLAYSTPYFMNYTTERIKFNYGGKDWMIQLWKGTYFITNGCEVGVYNRDEALFGSAYACADDEDCLDIQSTLYHGDDLILSRPTENTWWQTGFAVSARTWTPESFTFVGTITMKDADMLAAFTAALDGIDSIAYTVDGLNVTLVW